MGRKTDLGSGSPRSHAHAALPMVVLNFPAAHAVHALPSAPVKPAGHLQSVKTSVPSGHAGCEERAAVAQGLPRVDGCREVEVTLDIPVVSWECRRHEGEEEERIRTEE